MVVCAIALFVQGAGHSSQLQRLGRVHRADREEPSDTHLRDTMEGEKGEKGAGKGYGKGYWGGLRQGTFVRPLKPKHARPEAPNSEPQTFVVLAC